MVGIITMLFNSTNYGGVLQAYALCKVLNDMGCSAEHILYKKTDYSWKSRLYSILRVDQTIKNAINKTTDTNRGNFHRRKKCFDDFIDDYIPHTKKIYTNSTLKLISKKYSVYITGSDQVWCNGNPAYYLQFVDASKKCISYAASISREKLSQEHKEILPEYLSKFDGISVREELAVEQLAALGISSTLVVDPTLLLNKNQWDLVISERIEPERYLFCYFLGDNIRHRELSREYAKINGLKIVTLPNMQGQTRRSDEGFGDSVLYNVSPSDFLSLIKNADFILTDSYHAMVFSYIFHKQYVVFDRKIGNQSMSSRTRSLARMIDAQSRILDYDAENTIFKLNDIEYSKDNNILQQNIDASMLFLRNHLLR